MAHLNLGSWTGTRRPRVQVIVWDRWHGVRWHRWPGRLDNILRGSLMLGWVELRFWREA